jgi:hypothetical protein
VPHKWNLNNPSFHPARAAAASRQVSRVCICGIL